MTMTTQITPAGNLAGTGDASDGHPRCQDRADGWRDPNGRRLPNARHVLHVGPDRPFVAAFSAGGQIAKRLCLHPEDRAELAGLYTGDATYTVTWKETGKEAGLEELTHGFVLYALDALKDGRWWVATASMNPNKSYPSGGQTLAALWKAIEAESGRTFADAFDDPMLEGLRRPVRAGRMGNLLLLDFGAAYHHGEHATVIAPILLPRMIEASGAPATAAPAAPAPSSSTSSTASSSSTSSTASSSSTSSAPRSSWKAWALGAGAAAAAAWLWLRTRRPRWGR
jgi:hypothetical protein